MNIMSKKKVCFLSIIVGMFLWMPVYAVLGDNDKVLAAIIEGVGGLENYEKIPILHGIDVQTIEKNAESECLHRLITNDMMQVDGQPTDLRRGANNDFLVVRWTPTYIHQNDYNWNWVWSDWENRIFIDLIYKDSHGIWRCSCKRYSRPELFGFIRDRYFCGKDPDEETLRSIIYSLKTLTSGKPWGRDGGMLVEASTPEKRIAFMARHFKQRNEELEERGPRPEIPQMCIDAWSHVGKFIPDAKDMLSVASLSKAHMKKMWENPYYLEIVLKHAGIKTAEINSIPALLAEYDPCFTPPPWLATVVDPVTETHFQKALTEGRHGNDFGRTIIGTNIPKEKIKDCIMIISQILRLPGNNITALFLTHSNIGDEEAEMLAGALKHENCKVTILNLGSNNITSLGFQYYLSSIIGVIAILNLNHNKIDLLHNYIWSLALPAIGWPVIPHDMSRLKYHSVKSPKLQYVSVLSQINYDRGIWLMDRDSSPILSKTKIYYNGHDRLRMHERGDLQDYYHPTYYPPSSSTSSSFDLPPYCFMCDMKEEAVLEYTGVSYDSWFKGCDWKLLVLGRTYQLAPWGEDASHLWDWAKPKLRSGPY